MHCHRNLRNLTMTNKIRDSTVDLLSYPKEIQSTNRNRLTLDLSILSSEEDVKPHPSEDVAVIKLGEPKSLTP